MSDRKDDRCLVLRGDLHTPLHAIIRSRQTVVAVLGPLRVSCRARGIKKPTHVVKFGLISGETSRVCFGHVGISDNDLNIAAK